ncbi:MAG: hypothetical protein HY695_03930 [Deltaproteobacteria bacterium]|nr:hypothetical protein [Deltaproteobacteria bacterium]
MDQGKKKHRAVLQELISVARQHNIEVRTEKLLREIGYRVHNGRCRLRGKAMILIDRETPLSDQVDFLASELNETHRTP